MEFEDLLALIGQVGAEIGATYLSSSGPVGMLIRLGLEGELSGAAILRSFRGAGGRISTQKFYQILRSVRSTPLSTVDLGSILNGSKEFVQELPGGRAGTYRFDFTIHVTRSGAGGLPENTTTTFSILQREYDPEGAMNAMGAIASNMSDPESESGKWIGFELRSVGLYVGK